MTLSAALRSRSVLAALQYQEPSAEKPNIGFGYSGGALDVSVRYTPHRVSIRDAWPGAAALSIDVQGFAPVKHVSTVRDFGDDDEIERIGRVEAADIVWRASGAEEVLVFDHTVRRRAPDAARQPSTRVHNDYTETSGPQRVRDLLGAHAEALLRKRFAYVNVWRPIRHPAADWPLALCDARSAAPADFVATDIIYPDRRGEIYGLTYSPAHRWSYFPNMGLDEALLIKCYDSRRDVARFTPHVAFEDPNTPAGAPPRESVEYRAIAFFA